MRVRPAPGDSAPPSGSAAVHRRRRRSARATRSRRARAALAVLVLAHDSSLPADRGRPWRAAARMPSRIACSAAASRSAVSEAPLPWPRMKSSNASAVVRGREAELASPAGWCRPPGRARTGRSGPGRSARRRRCGPARRTTDSVPSGSGSEIRPARRTAWESTSTPAPATLYVPGWSSTTERCRISSASSTCTNCSRASRPQTVGTSGWAKYRVSVVSAVALITARTAARWRPPRDGGGGSRARTPRCRGCRGRTSRAAPPGARCPR